MTPSTSREQRAFAKRIKEARLGEASAQYDVALMYANGLGVQKSIEQALIWTESAAKKGHAAAQYLLGTAYQGGLGAPKDPVQAMAWLLKATESGSDKAPLKLAKILSLEAQALEANFMLAAAERGVAEAQLAVANNSALDAEAADGVDWTRRAAKQGLAAAQFALGARLEAEPDAAVEADSAEHWYREASAQGHPGAQLALVRLDQQGRGRTISAKAGGRKAAARERRGLDDRWDRYAARGTSHDQYQLGLMYQAGHGVDKSVKHARTWFQKAADAGHAEAQLALGNLLVTNAPTEALPWFHKAAAQGVVKAQLRIAESFKTGQGQAQSASRSLLYYAQAALNGDAAGLQGLADLVEGGADSLQQELTLDAAHRGAAGARYAMGRRYATGMGVEQDWRKAVEWYRKAADQGQADALCALGACYAEGLGVRRDIARAVGYWEDAALQDHPRALWSLGEILARGLPGLEPDARRAALLCKRAAHAGFAPAQATLAALFAQAKKYDKAVHWWSLAADQSDPEALFNLAHAYRSGWAEPSHEAQAFELLLRAANTGLAAAQARLGLAYATGDGAALDPIEAAKWFLLASQSGDAAAKANSQRAEQTLSPAQWREALRRMAAWVPAK